jgi:hypothetical protein
MSIRTQIAEMVAKNSMPGTNIEGKTRALIYTIISKFYPNVSPIDVATLPVCAWEDAEEWVYLGNAHAIMIGGFATPLKYGQRIGILVAHEARASGLEVIPIRNSPKTWCDPVPIPMPEPSEVLPPPIPSPIQKRHRQRKAA